MVGIPKSGPALARSPGVKLLLSGVVLGLALYMVLLWQPSAPPVQDLDLAPTRIPVPQLDSSVLAKAADRSREERLLLEPEPFRHLLEQSYNVTAPVAHALGLPMTPVPLADLRADPGQWRGRWLWYKGRLEELHGPRDGHPVRGASIYEATLRLADGETVFCAFSLPVPPEVHKGGWVRAEGFLLKLRDTTYPTEVREAPMLVGRELQLDYDDWGPVTELDPSLLATVDDHAMAQGSPTWRDIEDDQGPPLWHLAAFARDTKDRRSLAEWRKVPVLNADDTWDAIKARKVERGTPMRLMGVLVKKQIVPARANPAGIRHWTIAWLQIQDLRSKTVPVWVPGNLDKAKLLSSLEVPAYYYRRYAYEGQQGDQYWTPLFVAAALPEFQLDIGPTMRKFGIGLAIAFVLLATLIWWGQRNERRRAEAQDTALRERRKRRRQAVDQLANPTAPTAPPTEPLPGGAR